MWSTAREVAAGDMVILWLTRDAIQPLVITPGKEYNSKFGYYHHSDIIGVPYGSKVASKNGRGFMHILRPTPELWTLALPHRTQILYLPDISFICSWLDLRPGCNVIEAGTGSGSFSHSVARTVAPTGHLWSYEFHETRASKALEEFENHGMGELVTLTHRNVCKEGFTVVDCVDAVFLDLPAPWDAIEHAKKALRKNATTRICCFSPCMEQVLRTVTALNSAGFTDITMFESLQRPHDVSAVPQPVKVSEISAKLKQAEIRREDKRQRQIAANQRVVKRKHDEADEEVDETNSLEHKKAKTSIIGIEAEPIILSLEQAEDAPAPRTPENISSTTTVSKVFSEVKGHTSYPTFACLLPSSVREPFESEEIHSSLDVPMDLDLTQGEATTT